MLKHSACVFSTLASYIQKDVLNKRMLLMNKIAGKEMRDFKKQRENIPIILSSKQK